MITLGFPGRLVFGSLGDYTSKRTLMVLAMTPPQAVGIFVFIYGISYGGTIPLLYTFGADLFGRKRFASISGFPPFRMIGSVVGPIFAGYIFDVYDDYRFAFNVFSVFALLSIRGPSS